jgi:hypothetical protein
MPNDISALRNTLFSVLVGLKDGSCKIEVAKAINDTAQAIINSVKVEVDFMRASGKVVNSEFMTLLPESPKQDDGEVKSITAHGIKTVELGPGRGSVTTHRMR